MRSSSCLFASVRFALGSEACWAGAVTAAAKHKTNPVTRTSLLTNVEAAVFMYSPAMGP